MHILTSNDKENMQKNGKSRRNNINSLIFVQIEKFEFKSEHTNVCLQMKKYGRFKN